MQVELEHSLLLHPGTEHLLILAICAFGLDGRHRVIPDDRAAWDAWAATLPRSIFEELQLVWDDGESKSNLGPSNLRIQVCQSDELKTDPLAVTPATAVALLGRPLRVILENGRNDRAFLLAFADLATKKALLKAEQAGWLVFETAGGIGELRVRVEQALQGLYEHAAQADALRTMYLCDSDTREPGIASDDAQYVDDKLAKIHEMFRDHLSVPGRLLGWVLKRRAAENYAPPNQVLAWATASHGSEAWRLIREASTQPTRDALIMANGNPSSTRRQLLAAIALTELSETTRSVLCMKKGRGKLPKTGEGANWRTPDSVWGTLDPFQAAALRDGFGDRFSEIFYGQAEALRDETGEVTKFVRNILERL
jgi:hypothetical protein